jgi:ParB family chromosome partitioning protein
LEKRKGIRSLIPTGMLSEAESTVHEVPLDQVVRSRFQPRKPREDEGMEGLVESVRVHGILQPLVVRRQDQKLELIAGERRLQAARQAGLERVPVIVREATDREMLELALVENLQREDINAVDAAEAYQRLVTEFGLTQEQVAERVGKSRSSVANTLRLLSLPPPMRDSIRQGKLEEGHGKVLAGIADAGIRLKVWRRAVRRSLSVRETAIMGARLEARRVMQGPEAVLGQSDRLDPNLRDLEARLMHRLARKVRIRRRGRGGLIEMEYEDDADLDYLFRDLVV